MIGVFNTVSVGGSVIYRGNDFALQREYIYAGEIETCTGKWCGDLVGWRYSDLTLNWDNLPQAMLNSILDLTGQQVNFVFENEKGASVTEAVIPQIISSQATRMTDVTGNIAWKDVSLQLKFVNAHN